MTEPTREQIKEAFNKTIERWEKIVERPSYYRESHCNLCYLTTPDHNCNDYCPIQIYGNHAACGDTPFDAFYADKTPANALAELNFLRKVYIWWMEEGEKDKGWESLTGYKKEEKKEEWENVSEEIRWGFRPDFGEGFGVLTMTHKGWFIGHIWIDGEFYFTNNEYKRELDSRNFRILKKI